MDISLDLYNVFNYVAKYLSFSRAAQALFVSQSAISQSIASLEKKLDCKLFIRTTKSVSLTLNGQILYKYTQQIFSLLTRAEVEVAARQHPESGEIFIASTDTLCKYRILPKISGIQEKYPNVKINIINGTSPACLEMLRTATIDLAVVNLPKDFEEKSFKIEKKYQFRDVFVANEKYVAKLGEQTSLKELSKHPLLVLDNKTVTRTFFDRMFDSHGISVTPKVELQSVDLLVEMAKAGLGIAFVPELCVEGDLGSLKILALDTALEERSYGLLSGAQLSLSPVGRMFAEAF